MSRRTRLSVPTLFHKTNYTFDRWVRQPRMISFSHIMSRAFARRQVWCVCATRNVLHRLSLIRGKHFPASIPAGGNSALVVIMGYRVSKPTLNQPPIATIVILILKTYLSNKTNANDQACRENTGNLSCSKYFAAVSSSPRPISELWLIVIVIYRCRAQNTQAL